MLNAGFPFPFENSFGSSPNRVGGKDTRGLSAPGVRPVPGGTESAGTTRIPERIPRFRKAPVPDPLPKSEYRLQSGQLHHDPTRTDGRRTASLCPARDGMRLRGLSRIPPLESLPTADGKSTEFTHSIGRRSIHLSLEPGLRLSLDLHRQPPKFLDHVGDHEEPIEFGIRGSGIAHPQDKPVSRGDLFE
jgi:hypothetical protein